ncbi:MAG: hypothetical protein ACRDH9_09160 [Actinomycetota bacterium]
MGTPGTPLAAASDLLLAVCDLAAPTQLLILRAVPGHEQAPNEDPETAEIVLIEPADAG